MPKIANLMLNECKKVRPKETIHSGSHVRNRKGPEVYLLPADPSIVQVVATVYSSRPRMLFPREKLTVAVRQVIWTSSSV